MAAKTATKTATKAKKAKLAPFFETECVGEISVESGRIVIGDPCYIEHLKFDQIPHPGGVHESEIAEVVTRTEIMSLDQPELQKLFNRPCADITGADLNEPIPTEEEKKLGIEHCIPSANFKVGVVSNTNGDGCYRVFAKTIPGYGGHRDIVSLTIEFMDEDQVREAADYFCK